MALTVADALVAAILAASAGFAAWRGGWLTAPAAGGAAGLGTVVLLGGGWPHAIALASMFLITSLLEARRDRIERHDRAHADARRGFRQVLANGTPLALLAALRGAGFEGWPDAAFLGCLAAVSGDTWATALGEVSGYPARSLVGGARVPAGTPGAVTVVGLLATVAAGLAAFGCFAAGAGATGVAFTAELLAASVAGGVLGPLADGWLGASCRARPLANDLVNLAGGLVGALAGASAWWLLAAD